MLFNKLLIKTHLDLVQNMIKNLKFSIFQECKTLMEAKMNEEAKSKAESQKNFENEMNDKLNFLSSKSKLIFKFLGLKEEEIGNIKHNNLTNLMQQNLNKSGFITKDQFEREFNLLPSKISNCLIQNTENTLNIITDKVNQQIQKNIQDRLENFENKIDKKSKEQQFKEFTQYLINDLKNEIEESPFKDELVTLILTMISKSEVNMNANFERFLNMEFKCQSVEKIFHRQEAEFMKIQEKLEHMKTEYIEFENNLALKVEESMDKFRKSLNEMNLYNYQSLKSFDEQFESIFKGLGCSYNKIINSDNFKIAKELKELEIKKKNNITSDHLTNLINQNLTKINSRVENLESKKEIIFENLKKNQKEILELITSQGRDSNMFQVEMKKLEGKIDSSISKDKSSNND